MAQIKRLKFLVGGQWRDTKSGKYMQVMNPSLGIPIAEAPCCTNEEVGEAVTAAKAAFPKWRDTPIPSRIDLMFKFRGLLEQHLDHLKRRLKNIRIEHAAFIELAAVWQAIDTAVR